MRTFFWFLGLLLAGFAAIALFAYPAWLLLHPHFDFPFHRIASRVGMLALPTVQAWATESRDGCLCASSSWRSRSEWGSCFWSLS
jgi:hypothetical protein